MAKYSLVGQDGNAFALMGYTSRALRDEGLRELVPEMQNKAMSGGYCHLIAVCVDYLDIANAKAIENGYEEDSDDDF